MEWGLKGRAREQRASGKERKREEQVEICVRVWQKRGRK